MHSRRFVYGIAAIAILTLALYLPHAGNAFVEFDDPLLITQNPLVQSFTFANVQAAFTSFDPELYVPLTTLSFQFQHLLFANGSTSYHVVNILLHVLSAVLLAYVLRRLTKREGIALAVAAIYAVHPLQTEGVMWAAARKDVLSTMFLLAGVLSYLRYRDDDERAWYWWAFAFMLLGVLSKVTVVVAPVIFLGIDWVRGQVTRESAKDLWPFAVLAALFLAIAIVGKSGVIAAASPIDTVLLAFKMSAFSAWHALWPTGYSVLYPQSLPMPGGDVALSAAFVVAALASFVVLLRSGRRLEGACIAWFFVTLAPNVFNTTKNGFVFFASDRYASLPSVAVVLLLCLAASALLRRIALPPFVGAALACVAVAVLAPIAWTQAGTWQNTVTLFTHTLSLYPQSALAHNSVGDELRQQGRVEEATREFHAAIEADPTYGLPHADLALMAMDRHDVVGAEAAYKEAIAAVEQRRFRGTDEANIFFLYAAFLQDQGREAEALPVLERAVTYAPNLAITHLNLALMYLNAGRASDGERELRATIDRDSRDVQALYTLAGLVAAQGKLEEARDLLRRVVRLQPWQTQVQQHLQQIEQMIEGQ